MLRFVAFLVAGAACLGSAVAQEFKKDCTWKESARVENVVRVFMRQPWSYSFMVQTGEKTFSLVNLSGFDGIRFLADVPPDKPMWVRKLVCDPDKWHSGVYIHLDIHLHAVKDVEGAGWDAGKSGSGTTQVIQ